MKSPFPGMDPYLEEHWGDVLASLAVYASNSLQKQLPADLVARIDVTFQRWTTASVVPPKNAQPPTPVLDAATTPTPPHVITRHSVERRLRSVRVLARNNANRVVTTVELISPCHKTEQGRQRYLRKRYRFLAGRVSLVEIDLIREGRHLLRVAAEALPVEVTLPYRVCVTRGWRRRQIEFYPAGYRERLPVVAVPLRRTDPDVTLDLQQLIDEVYETGRYEQTDYRRPPVPPLPAADAKWAAALLKKATRH